MLSDGDLLMSLTGNVGRVGVLTSEFLPAALNQRVACLRIKESTGVNLKYLFHIFNSKTFEDDCIINATGIAQKNMSTKWLENYLIPVPPIAEQEKIVAELDCLSGIIEKKKQQLKELDNLAQSIFYEMFGDPVENDKGWEVKKLSYVCPYITDGSHYSPRAEDIGEIPMLSVKDMRQNRFSYDNCKMISYDEYLKLLSAGCKPNKGDVLIAKDGSYFKYIFEVKEDREQAVLSSIAIVRPDVNLINSSYLVGYLSTSDIYKYVERELLTGTAIKRVILKGLRNMKVIIPPLSLQQDFASKIESIEKQKELISQSIKETETLFNSRMDYYFS
jgi:type I restriction enzyme S subunit